MKVPNGTALAGLLMFLTFSVMVAQRGETPDRTPGSKIVPHEVNQVAQPPSDHLVAIVGATLLDGTGAQPLVYAAVVVQGDKIVAAGPRIVVKIPAAAEVFDAKELTLLPGLIDSHFHIDGDDKLPALYL